MTLLYGRKSGKIISDFVIHNIPSITIGTLHMTEMSEQIQQKFDAAKAIRSMERSDAELPIFAMAADAFAEGVLLALDSGMNERIAKPLNLENLMLLLKKYL